MEDEKKECIPVEETNLPDYELEIDESKRNFFSRMISKIKERKSQKLLNPGNEELVKTTKSINFLWRFAEFRTNLFNKFESFNLQIEEKPKKIEDEVLFEIIGNETNLKNDLELANKKISNIIIPQNIKTNKKENLGGD